MSTSDRFDAEINDFGRKIDHENEQRVMTSRLGYRLTNDWWLTVVRCYFWILVVQAMVVFIPVFTGGLPRGAADQPLWLLAFLPMATLPVFPFLILKLRYALYLLAFLVMVGATCFLLVHYGFDIWIWRQMG